MTPELGVVRRAAASYGAATQPVNRRLPEARRVRATRAIHERTERPQASARDGRGSRAHDVPTTLEVFALDAHELFWSFLPEAADPIERSGAFIRSHTRLSRGRAAERTT